MNAFQPPVGISSSRVHKLYEFWEDKRGGKLAPTRGDIDPSGIKDLLPFVLIGEFLHSPFDIRYRFVGTALVEAYGHDFMGHNLRAMPVTTGLDRWLAHYRRVFEEKHPFYGRYRGEIGPDLVRFVDQGAFPLSNDGTNIEQFLEIEDWSEIRGINPASMEHSVWSFEPY
jgi:PAS domain